jgi:hypothetical protein
MLKKLNNVFNWTNLVKVLVIFLIGFISRILIYHYLDVNLFTDYTNYIYILRCFGLFYISAYFDQLFSFQYSVPTNVNYNIKFFKNDFKTANLLFTKDHNNSSSSPSPTDHSSRYSKNSRKYVTTNGSYTYLRPVINGKGDIILVPGLDIGKHSSNSLSSRDNTDSISNMPSAPKPSNLSTPSTMSPLFPSSRQSSLFAKSSTRSPLPFNTSRESQWYTTTNSTHTKSTGDIPVLSDKRHSFRRNTFDTADFADRRRKIIETVQLKIKESGTKTSFLGKISSGLKYRDSNVVSKLLNESTGNTDPRWIEITEEMRRRRHHYEWEGRKNYAHWYKKNR